MAYIIFVNPSILKEAGVPFSGALFATCIAAAIGSLLRGLLANYPFALAPGMGLNAYFTYTVVLGLKHDWRVALGAVFISGVVFLLLTFSIANGLTLGFIFYPLLKVLAGRGRDVSPLVYVRAVVFLLRYAYLSGE
jgi:AGZA family xanthine/uracil permease-like MFS transporter